MSDKTIERDCDGTYVDAECANRNCKNAEHHCAIREKIPDLTDAELVEAVAREVLGWEPIQWIEGSLYVRKPENETSVPGETYLFEPFHDANDWMMVLERQVEWQILRDKDNHWCVIWRDGFMVGAAHDPNLARAVLEAALKAKGEKG